MQPAVASQEAAARRLGLRSRLLPLSVLVALVISLIWRQLGAGGSEAARLLSTEGLLWSGIITVAQQAISLRLRVFPAALFRWRRAPRPATGRYLGPWPGPRPPSRPS